ncbi:MAG TPA: hypothetical protein V6D17_12740 [Candidatus Obscuribacterales bacterium]
MPPASKPANKLVAFIIAVLFPWSGFLLAGCTEQKSTLESAKQSLALGKAHWKEAKLQFASALASAKKKNDSLTAARIHISLGKIALFESDYVKAFNDFSEALKLLKDRQNDFREDYLGALVGAAEAQTLRGLFRQARAALTEARGLADKWKPQAEILGDIELADARLAAKADNKRENAASFYEKALQAYEKSSTMDAEKKTEAWLESAHFYSSIPWKRQACIQAEGAIKSASGIVDEAARTELVRQANDIIQLNPTVSSQSNQAPSVPANAPIQVTPSIPAVPPQSAAVSHPTSIDVTTLQEEAELRRQQLEQIRRAQEYTREMGRIQDANFKRVTEELRRQSYPAGQSP